MPKACRLRQPVGGLAWELLKNLEGGGHCVYFKENNQHYHTRALTEQDKRWYLDRHWIISRHCLHESTKGLQGNPDQTWGSFGDC